MALNDQEETRLRKKYKNLNLVLFCVSIYTLVLSFSANELGDRNTALAQELAEVKAYSAKELMKAEQAMLKSIYSNSEVQGVDVELKASQSLDLSNLGSRPQERGLTRDRETRV